MKFLRIIYYLIENIFFSFRTDQTVLTTAGCMTDVITLRRMIAAKLTQ